MTRTFLRSAALASLMLSLVACSKDDTTVTPTPVARTLQIGGLFSTTGNWNTLGKAGVAAAELAVADINAEFERNGSTTRLSFVNRDTKLEPATALDAIRSLAATGVHVVVGPQSSAEVSMVKAFADSAGVVVLSPSSTAGSLAIAGDNIIRMCPADVTEGKAISAMIVAEGRTDVVMMWRDDLGNNGLHASTTTALKARGANVVDATSYAADATDFNAVLNTLRAAVTERISAVGAEHVAVYNPGFNEVATIFASIPANDVLRLVHWYGGDGTVMSEVLLPQAEFCTQVSYPNPQFGIGEGAAIAGPIAQRIKDRSGVDPDAYALSVHDAIWLASKAYAADLREWNAKNFVEGFLGTANYSFGVTGWTLMDDKGDRSFGNYDMMGVRIVNGTAVWKRIGAYDAASDTYKAD